MKEIQASEAKTQLLRLLGEVERGESFIITRHGAPIARLVPEESQRQAGLERAMSEIEEFRKTMPRLSLGDILSARHEGHKY
jgi:prevent-host-death family protein